VHVEGGAEGARERLGVGEVVAVMVRENDGIDPAREEVAAERAHPAGGDLGADPGVDEDTRAVRVDKKAVTG
jgi:hypothetical protein